LYIFWPLSCGDVAWEGLGSKCIGSVRAVELLPVFFRAARPRTCWEWHKRPALALIR
jgi:hypothetical protein